MPGFEKGKRLTKIGLKAQDTSELFFNDVRVSLHNLLGPESSDFVSLMEELAWARMQRICGGTNEIMKEVISQRKRLGAIEVRKRSRVFLAERRRVGGSVGLRVGLRLDHS